MMEKCLPRRNAFPTLLIRPKLFSNTNVVAGDPLASTSSTLATLSCFYASFKSNAAVIYCKIGIFWLTICCFQSAVAIVTILFQLSTWPTASRPNGCNTDIGQTTQHY